MSDEVKSGSRHSQALHSPLFVKMTLPCRRRQVPLRCRLPDQSPPRRTPSRSNGGHHRCCCWTCCLSEYKLTMIGAECAEARMALDGRVLAEGKMMRMMGGEGRRARWSKPARELFGCTADRRRTKRVVRGRRPRGGLAGYESAKAAVEVRLQGTSLYAGIDATIFALYDALHLLTTTLRAPNTPTIHSRDSHLPLRVIHSNTLRTQCPPHLDLLPSQP